MISVLPAFGSFLKTPPLPQPEADSNPNLQNCKPEIAWSRNSPDGRPCTKDSGQDECCKRQIGSDAGIRSEASTTVQYDYPTCVLDLWTGLHDHIGTFADSERDARRKGILNQGQSRFLAAFLGDR